MVKMLMLGRNFRISSVAYAIRSIAVPQYQHFRTYSTQDCSAAAEAGVAADIHSPLAGIRVLDLTRIVAGPFCTMILGDLGAEILKIEKPGSGDEARHWGPPFVEDSKESCYFVAVNRNKKSVCIDIKSNEGLQVVYDLARKCDILVENYVPGKLDKIGLGYEKLRKIAPDLIYCSLTGYGSKGPYSHRPGYDVIAASVGGLVHMTGPQEGEPCKVGVAMTDLATGLFAHGAIMAALIQRGRTGKGQKVDCNLLSTQVACLINVGSNFINAGQEAKRWGTAHQSIVPYESFQTQDGSFLTICTGSNLQFQALCKKMNMPELSTDSRFANNQLRVENRKVLTGLLREKFRLKRMEEWLNILEGSPFPYGPVNNMAEVFRDPHIQEIGLVKEMKYPTGAAVKVVGPPVVYSDAVNAVRLPPPLLGQHSTQVLQDTLGYSLDKINNLRRVGAIQ